MSLLKVKHILLIGEPFLWAKRFLRYPPPILISHWICTELNDHLDQPAQGRNSAHGRKIWTPVNIRLTIIELCKLYYRIYWTLANCPPTLKQ